MIWVYINLIITIIPLCCYANNSEYNSFLLEELNITTEKLRKSPNDTKMILRYSNIQWGLGNYDKAEIYARNALSMMPNEPNMLLNLSIILFSQQKYNEMFTLLEQLKKITPQNPAIYDLYSKYYHKIDDKDKEYFYLISMLSLVNNQNDSIPYIDGIIAIDDKNDNSFLIPSKRDLEYQIVEKMEKYQNLISLYQTINDTTSNTLIMEKKGKIKISLEELIMKYPRISILKIYYAAILSTYGRNEDAKDILLKLINESPKYTESYVLMAYILKNENKISEALNYLNKAEQISTNPNIFFLQGQIYEKTKQYEQAIKEYSKGVNEIKSRGNELSINYYSDLNHVMENKIIELQNR